MDRIQPFNSFQLQNHKFLNYQIHSEGTLDFKGLIVYRHTHLGMKLNSPQIQFMTQTSFISRLKQSRAKMPVYFNCCTNHFT